MFLLQELVEALDDDAWNRLLDRLEAVEYAPGNTFLHQPGIMLGTLELKLEVTLATS